MLFNSPNGSSLKYYGSDSLKQQKGSINFEEVVSIRPSNDTSAPLLAMDIECQGGRTHTLVPEGGERGKWCRAFASCFPEGDVFHEALRREFHVKEGEVFASQSVENLQDVAIQDVSPNEDNVSGRTRFHRSVSDWMENGGSKSEKLMFTSFDEASDKTFIDDGVDDITSDFGVVNDVGEGHRISGGPGSQIAAEIANSEYEFLTGWKIQRLCAEYQQQSSTLVTASYNIDSTLKPLLGRLLSSILESESQSWSQKESDMLTELLADYRKRLKDDTSQGPTSHAFKINYILRPLLLEKLAQKRPFDKDPEGAVRREAAAVQVKPPPLNIVLMTVGSRGDVQPFIALAKGLQADGHNCRLG